VMALPGVGARTVGLLDSGDMDVPAPDRRLAAGIATTAVAIYWRTNGFGGLRPWLSVHAAALPGARPTGSSRAPPATLGPDETKTVLPAPPTHSV
jgi:hypothetical protein